MDSAPSHVPTYDDTRLVPVEDVQAVFAMLIQQGEVREPDDNRILVSELLDLLFD